MWVYFVKQSSLLCISWSLFYHWKSMEPCNWRRKIAALKSTNVTLKKIFEPHSWLGGSSKVNFIFTLIMTYVQKLVLLAFFPFASSSGYCITKDSMKVEISSLQLISRVYSTTALPDCLTNTCVICHNIQRPQ